MSHWYSPETSKRVIDVLSADGSSREPTLRDARKYGYVPSVTGIVGVVDKPMLTQWRVNEAIKAALHLPVRIPSEPEEERIERIKAEANKYADWAASFGVEIHHGINVEMTEGATALLGHPGSREILDGFWGWYHDQPLCVDTTEQEFASPLGYGGTVDWIGSLGSDSSSPIICDWKTQDFDEPDRARFYPEMAIQLAGYNQGLLHEDCAWWSVVISRTAPGCIAVRVWDEHEKWTAMFNHLFEYWKLANRWTGGIA